MKIMKFANIASVATLLLLTHHCDADEIKFTGESVSTPALTITILKTLLPSYISNSGCHSPVQSIHRKVLVKPNEGELSTLIKNIQPHAWTVKESWDVSGCGKVTPMIVNIGRDNDGILAFDSSFPVIKPKSQFKK